MKKLAPNFTLNNQNGQPVSLHDFLGKSVVLYFYPKDMTPGCTTQACNFRDDSAQYGEYDAVILGVSADDEARHTKFIEKHALPFTLLADTTHEVCEQYGVWVLKKMFGKEYYGIERSTFLIDKEGNIVKEWRKVKVKNHSDEVLTALRELNA